VSEEQRRIPHVRELAIVGDYAVIGGHSAFFLSRLLGGYPGGLERLLARSGIPAERADDVMKAVSALVYVGTIWQLEQESASASGTGLDSDAGSHVRSSRHDGFTKSENGEPSSRASGLRRSSALRKLPALSAPRPAGFDDWPARAPCLGNATPEGGGSSPCSMSPRSGIGA
jgi:hypothetical protein